MTTASVDVEQEYALIRAARRVRTSESFVEYLRYVKIRSDDPDSPGIAPWEAWPALVERAEAWERREDEVILKARQLGFTWLVAAYLSWRARNGAACAVFSAGQRESREILRRIRFIETNLPPWMRSTLSGTVDDVQYPDSTGSVYAFPSTEQAGISFTFQVVVADESAFHPYGAANYAAYRPTISAGGQFLCFSTADPELGPAGFFHDLYWASARGETPYTAVFVPWNARPDRDAVWLERERAAFAVQPERFNAYYPNTPAEAFVGKSGLVYPMFSEQRHVTLAHPWEWAASKRKVAGVDFGGGDPTAVTMLGMSGAQHVHQFGEFYQRGAVSVYDIAAFFGQWPGPGEALCDPSQGIAIETLDVALRGTGWRARPADNRRGEGLELVAFLLESDRITIHESNRDSIHEFAGYRWRERVDPSSKERYATSTPVDNHADAMDGRRYGLMELMAHLRPMLTLPTTSLSGKPLARSMS